MFVIVTSPFTKKVDRYPVQPKLLAHGSKQVTDGKKLLLRTIDLILDADFREDLTLMLESNPILAWRKRTYDAVTTTLTPTQRETFDLKFAEIDQSFPLHSYNEAPDGGPSLPYDTVVVAPEKVYAGSFEVDPENIALHLHYGRLEADRMTQEDFHMNSMKKIARRGSPCRLRSLPILRRTTAARERPNTDPCPVDVLPLRPKSPLGRIPVVNATEALDNADWVEQLKKYLRLPQGQCTRIGLRASVSFVTNVPRAAAHQMSFAQHRGHSLVPINSSRDF